MRHILVTGAGGAPSTNFIRSLRKSPEKFFIVGIDANEYYLMRAEVDKRYLVPAVDDPLYLPVLNRIIRKEKIEFLHAQNDYEITFLSEHREEIQSPVYLPSKETIRICQNKFLSYQKWKTAGIKIPETMMINSVADLTAAFKKFHGNVWIRRITGAAGNGSLPVHDLETATHWIHFHKGWGNFTAAQLLEKTSTTWMSLWHNGELIVAQGRKRLYWEMAKVAPSGITGVTGTGVTIRDPMVNKIALKTIYAIDPKPHGLYGVDLTYDADGIPNPTEINIGRFFTTHLFFTEAGVNMPYIYTKLAFKERYPAPHKIINPLPVNLLWIRGMDFLPILSNTKKVQDYKKTLKLMKAAIT